jgi:hypothetical protein
MALAVPDFDSTVCYSASVPAYESVARLTQTASCCSDAMLPSACLCLLSLRMSCEVHSKRLCPRLPGLVVNRPPRLPFAPCSPWTCHWAAMRVSLHKAFLATTSNVFACVPAAASAKRTQSLAAGTCYRMPLLIRWTALSLAIPEVQVA